MLVRVAGVLRALAYVAQLANQICLIGADIAESAGFNSDVDTLIWLFLLFCVVTRRFSLFFSLIALIVFSSPVWQALKAFVPEADGEHHR